MRSNRSPSPASKSLAGLATVAAIAVATATCGDGGDGPTTPLPPELQNLLLSRSADTLLVNEASVLDVVARDEDGDEIPLGDLAIEWTALDPAILKVNSDGVVRAVGGGTGRVSVSAGDVADTAEVQVFELSDEPSATDILGIINVPVSVDTASAFVSTVIGGSSLIGGDGSFTTSVSTSIETSVLALTGGDLFGFTIVPPFGNGGSSASGPAAEAQDVDINAQETAVSLVYFTPLFASAPSAITEPLLALIREVPEVGTLGELLAERVDADGVLPDASDSEFVDAYRAAVAAAQQEVADQAGFESVDDLMKAALPPLDGSGMTINLPDEISTAFDVEVQNHSHRWVNLYEVPADPDGMPIGSGAHKAWMGSAAAGDVTDLAGWYAFLNGDHPSADPMTLSLEFSVDQPRFLWYAYGPGVNGLSEDLESIGDAGNHGRWVASTALSTVVDVGVPAVERIIGFDLANVAAEDIPQVVETIDPPTLMSGFQSCMQDDALSTGGKMLCTNSETTERVLLDEDKLGALAMQLKPDLDEARLRILRRAVDRIGRLVATADDVGDIAPTGFAAGNAELRHEFDFSYNDLLGATNVQIVSGDGQTGTGGEPLSEPIVVQVTDDAGAPVQNAWVAWEPGDGSGSASPSTSTTDANGEAQTTWTLGPDDNADQSLDAVLAGTRTAVGFSATATPSEVIVFSHDGTGVMSVYGMNTDGSNERLLSSPGFQPRISPDGSKIVFYWFEDNNCYLAITDANGANRTRVDPTQFCDRSPAWSPDGNSIVFVSDAAGNFDLYTIDADGTNLQQLTETPFIEWGPSWSSDGNSLLFSSAETGDLEVYRMELATGQVTRITDDASVDDYYPVENADGSQILFSKWVGQDAQGLYVMDSDGTNVQEILAEIGISQSWSVDQTRVVAPRDADVADADIVAVDVDGTDFADLANQAGVREDSPDWHVCNGCVPAAPSVAADHSGGTKPSALPPERRKNDN